MKRLVILSFDYPPNNGGIARLCGEIINCCKERGFPYYVVTNCPGYEENNVIRITGHRGLVEIKILHHLKKHLKQGDVILTGTFHPDGILGVLSGVPTYYLAHGAEYLPGHGFFRKYIWPFYRRAVLSLPKGIVSNSSYTANLVRRCYSNAKVTPIPLAVDPYRFHPTVPKKDDEVLRICSVSRLEKFKAQDFLIKTIGNLPAQYRDKIRVEIAGKGPYKQDLESLVDKFHLQKNVEFLGYVSDEELCDFYSRNDIFALLTREERDDRNVEGFGLVFLEAQACGTACIGTRSGGIPDAVFEGEGGWLIEQDNEIQLRTILMDLVDNKELARVAGTEARQRVERECTWSKYFDKLIRVLA